MKTKIISLLNQKGGAGKTLLSIHIADYLSKQDNKVLLIDADSQASSLDWSSISPNDLSFPVISLPKPTIHKDIKAISAGNNFIIIDSPPRAHNITKSIIMSSNLVLIPVQPSPLDIWAAKIILEWIEEVTNIKRNIKTRFVINRKIVNSVIGNEVKNTLKTFPVKQMKTQIHQRVGFTEALALGKTILDTEKKSLGAKEIKKLTNEILGLLKNG